MDSGLIEIFCDDGRNGMGHLRRSMALAQTLRARGRDVRLKVDSPEGRELQPDAAPAGTPAALWVFDLPDEIAPWVDAAQERGIPCAALDYFGGAEPTLTISVLERGTPSGGRRLSGLEYSIIRGEITSAAVFEGTGVLVLFGSGDMRREGVRVAEELARAGETVTLIAGPLVDDGYSVSGADYRVEEDPPDLPAKMARCAWGVVNGGVTMTEMLYLGKPVYVVPQTPEEENLARHVYASGALLGVGLEAVEAPAEDAKARVSTASRRLIDGRGLERIADALEELM